MDENQRATIVDIHCHVFNGEDLPIDGFLKHILFQLPSFLVAALAKLLEELINWRTPGFEEKEKLVAMLKGKVETESLRKVVLTHDSVTDDEVLQLLHQSLISPGGKVIMRAQDQFDQVANVLRQLDQDKLNELSDWAEKFGDQRELVRHDMTADRVKSLLGKLLGPLKRVILAIRLIMNFRYGVAAKLANTYKEAVLFTPSLVDFGIPANDEPSTRYADQIIIHSLVSKLSILGKLPGCEGVRIHPFVGFDPFREIRETTLNLCQPQLKTQNPYTMVSQSKKELEMPTDWESRILDVNLVKGSLNLVRHAIEIGGYVGVKVYPPAGFSPLGNEDSGRPGQGERLDAALRSLYSYCQEKEVPILAHASNSNAFEKGFGEFAGPSGWEHVLNEYPNLRLCLGHFGHMDGIDMKHPKSKVPTAWVWEFITLMDSHENVYSDVGKSKFRCDEKYREAFLEMLEAIFADAPNDTTRHKRKKRILYGSDWWLNSLSPDPDKSLISFQDYYSKRFGSQSGKDLMGRNALRYLGFLSQDDSPNTANLNRQRLVRFYGTAPLPNWL